MDIVGEKYIDNLIWEFVHRAYMRDIIKKIEWEKRVSGELTYKVLKYILNGKKKRKNMLMRKINVGYQYNELRIKYPELPIPPGTNTTDFIRKKRYKICNYKRKGDHFI